MPHDREPPIREFADRGVKWLLDDADNLRGLLRLARPDLAEKVDFGRAERVDRSFIPDDLRKLEADVIYRAPFKKGRSFVWIYVLLEHQSKPDRRMGFRLLCYMVELWQAEARDFDAAKRRAGSLRLSPIIPIVLYTGQRKWTTELSLQALMDLPDSVPVWQTLFIDLQLTPPEKLTQLGDAVLLALRAIQAADAPKEELERALTEVAGLVDAMPADSQAAIRDVLYFVYLLIYHKRDAGEQDELSRVVEASVKHYESEREEARMTGADMLLKRGREEGRDAGVRETVPDLLTDKFGAVPSEISARVLELSRGELVRVRRAILAAQSVDDLGL
ncbi:MAG TPA: Rpn family recombination-promoting nuclease/putative transposase [Chthonomonadaceae bacterium]|nr:Rpn family recombination-promoting nuclease/putative transposase [Chthonomonadaceae bacterium]